MNFIVFILTLALALLLGIATATGFIEPVNAIFAMMFGMAAGIWFTIWDRNR